MALALVFSWLNVKSQGGVTVARLTLDDFWAEDSIEALGSELSQLAGSLTPPLLVLDMHHVTALGSYMIAQLLALTHQTARAGGRLVLCRLRPELIEVLDICRMTRLFSIYPDENAAVRSFGPDGF